MPEKEGLPKNYEEYVSLLRENKDNPEKLQEIVDASLSEFYDHYDKEYNFGHIAETTADAYEKLISTEENVQVKNTVCGPIHQIAAQALNDAGIESGVVTVLRPNPKAEGGHNVLLYSAKPGEYVMNNYGKSSTLNADNFIDATETAISECSNMLTKGTVNIYRPDGEHYAYSEMNIGRILPKDHDKNSIESLSKPLDMLKSSSDIPKGVNIDYASKTGKDNLYGEYNINAVSVNKSKNSVSDNGYEKTKQVEIGFDKAKAIDDYGKLSFNDKISVKKQGDYSILHASYDKQIKTPELITKNDNLSAKGFLHGNVQGYAHVAKGTLQITGETFTNENISRSLECDLSTGMMAGVSTRLGDADKNNIGVNVVAGPRLALDTNLFSQMPKPALEKVAGAEIYGSLSKDSSHWKSYESSAFKGSYYNKENWGYGVDGKAAIFKVDANYYDKTSTSLGLRGYAQNNKNDISLYYENTNEAVKIDGYRGIHKDNSKIIGAEWNRTIVNKPNRNTSVGFKGEYEKANTGNNFGAFANIRIGF